jgi:hypothetical protein
MAYFEGTTGAIITLITAYGGYDKGISSGFYE